MNIIDKEENGDMYIKKIVEYNFNYAEYVVGKGENELSCMCVSVPLPNNQELKEGMKVSMIYAFTNGKLELINLYDNEKATSIKKGKPHFEYTLVGKIVDMKESLVDVNGFTISLEFEFANGLPEEIYNIGDMVSFKVDRLDSELYTD